MRHKPIVITWPAVVQVVIGLFFLATAYEKLIDGFFGRRTAPLRTSLEWWLAQRWPAPGYHQFLELLLPYSDILAALVIAMQAFAGASLFLNVGRKYGAWVLLFVQFNIFLGTFFGGIGFTTFVGLSLWLAAYYILLDDLTPKKWRLLTYGIILMGVLIQYRRYWIGDPWIDSFGWQKSHFAADVMGISPALKALTITVSETVFGPLLWASFWWILAGCILLMFSRYRLYAGALWLLILIGREWIWLNAVTGEGVLWVITIFAWLTAEEEWQHRHGVLPLLPTAEQAKKRLDIWKRKILGFRFTVRGWRIDAVSLFFGSVTAVIVVFFVVPSAFGLQNFNQWGGMYDDHWCHIEAYSANPHVVTGAALSFELENAGETQTRWVFTTPMHNHATCLMWGRTRCGRTAVGGWPIAFVNVYMNDVHYAGTDNLCDFPLPEASLWFPNADEKK